MAADRWRGDRRRARFIRPLPPSPSHPDEFFEEDREDDHVAWIFDSSSSSSFSSSFPTEFILRTGGCVSSICLIYGISSTVKPLSVIVSKRPDPLSDRSQLRNKFILDSICRSIVKIRPWNVTKLNEWINLLRGKIGRFVMEIIALTTQISKRREGKDKIYKAWLELRIIWILI